MVPMVSNRKRNNNPNTYKLMKGGSNIVSGIQHLKRAFEHFESFRREYPGSKGERLFKGFNQRLNWVYSEMSTSPFLPEDIREGIKKEWNSDVFTVDAIAENVALLSPEQRELVDTIIEGLLSGEQIQFVQ